MGATLSTGALRVLAVLVAFVWCAFSGAEGAWGAGTQNFFSPGDHSYTVPAQVTSITVTAIGAPGGNCTPAHGGRGASLTATVPVSPGEALVVVVAGSGGPCNGTAPGGVGGGGAGGAGTMGTNGGGPGAGGGGASVVAPGTSSPDFSRALVVAGGGGGSSQVIGAGVNGGDAGSPGNDGAATGSGGGAGTQSTGGSGGVAGDSNAQAGLSGSLGTGGAGGHADMSTMTAIGGGGGGGGYYGGGGGGGSGPYPDNSGSGGGGSSYLVVGATNVVGPTPTSSTIEVSITPIFTVAPTATISAPGPGGTYTQGQHVPTMFSCADAAGAPGLASCTDSNGASMAGGGKGHLDTSTSGTSTYTVTATSKDGLIGKASITYKVVPSRVKITGATISTAHATAKFTFKATGQATGFQCAILKQKKHHKQSRASFSSCRSPKLYKHLRPGGYTFEVRSVNAGLGGTPASKRFTIT